MPRGIAAAILLLVGCNRAFGIDNIPSPDAPPPDAAAPPTLWMQVSAAAEHTCGIRSDDHSLRCWGRSFYPPYEVETPAKVDDNTWSTVSATANRTCAIRTDQSLWCWGKNDEGQLGVPGSPTDQEMVMVMKNGVPVSWLEVATMGDATFALDTDHTLWTWGLSQNGELAENAASTATVMPPTQRSTGPWHELVAGTDFGCMLDDHGAPNCWGLDNYGEAGVPGGVAPLTPTAIAGFTGWTHLTAGVAFACGLGSGRIWCWGDDTTGQRGDDNIGSGATAVPAEIDDGEITDWTEVAAGAAHACALRSDGSLWCWGEGRHGELGGSTVEGKPKRVSAGPWSALALAGGRTCVLDGTGALSCMGLSGLGQLVPPGSHVAPTQLPGMWSAVAAGDLSTCALAIDGTASCWGSNASDALGDGTTIDREVPGSVSGMMKWSAIAASRDACAIAPTGIFCWGANEAAQTGATGPNVPMPTMAVSGAFDRIAAAAHTCAIEEDSLFCWGRNDYGQCGVAASPTAMPAAIPNEVFSEVATGLFHTCALSVDRTRLECWGSNALGELGPMALTGSSASPVVVPVGGVSQWDEVGAGAYVSCGRTGGDVYCWGFGGLGQLGNQSTGSSTVPVKVKLDSGAFIHLAVGLFHTCGILADRTLWCWGHNTYGEIGDGSFTDRREPTQVGTDTDWQTVSAGDEHTCATKLDQTLWCWGRDDLGQIGDNTAWTPTLTLVH